MLVAVGSFKGSPGATAAALVLAAGWPMPAIAVEADPDGGDLALRLRPDGREALPPRPSVLSLAADARSTSGPGGLVDEIALEVAPGVRVVQGFLDPGRAHGMASLWPDLAKALAGSDTHVVVDVGRLKPKTPASPIVASADALVVVARGETGSAAHLKERIAAMAGSGPSRQHLYPLVVSPPRSLAADVARVAEVMNSAPGVAPGVTYREVLGLAHDPGALGLLYAGADPAARRLRRSALMRSAVGAAQEIHDGVLLGGQAVS